MAKKKTMTVIADGYKIDVRRNVDGIILALDFVAHADDEEYTLRVRTMDEQTALAQKLLRKAADLWPARDLHVIVSGHDIIDVPS